MIRRPPRSTLFPSTPLFRSLLGALAQAAEDLLDLVDRQPRRHVEHDLRAHRFVARLVAGLRNAAGPHLEERQSQRRSEEHTSELQSPCNLVCRLLLEKKKIT